MNFREPVARALNGPKKCITLTRTVCLKEKGGNVWKDTSFIVFTWLSVTVNMNLKHGKHTGLYRIVSYIYIFVAWNHTGNG